MESPTLLFFYRGSAGFGSVVEVGAPMARKSQAPITKHQVEQRDHLGGVAEMVEGIAEDRACGADRADRPELVCCGAFGAFLHKACKPWERGMRGGHEKGEGFWAFPG